MPTLRTRLRALLPAVLLGFLAAVPAAAQPAPAAVKSRIVEAGSLDNSFKVTIANANGFGPLNGVEVRLASRLHYVTNFRIEPAGRFDLDRNGSREVLIRFDIDTDVPETGARETVELDVRAAEGILDLPRLTLHLGIETDKTSFAIVPFVVGKSAAEARRDLANASLAAAIELAAPPQDPILFDTVAEQSVAAGTIVESGATVGLVAFPPGSVVVPEVAGLAVPEAARLVEAAGLDPQVAPLGGAPSAEKANRVDRSEPAAGTEVAPGSPVSLLAYGDYTAPPPAAEGPAGPPAPVGALWDQPWRGEIKLAVVIANDKESSADDAMTLSKKEPEKPSGVIGGLAEAGAATAGAITEGIGAALSGIMEAMFKFLKEGVPLSITLAEEQGGFRLSIPGSSPGVDKINASLTQAVPLLLPDGGGRLSASRDLTDAGMKNTSLSITLTAAPDWQQLDVRIGLKAGGLKEGSLTTLELVLTGTARPGLYPAAEYEAELKRRVERIMK